MQELQEIIGSDGKRKTPRLSGDVKNYLIDIDGCVSEDIPNEEPERMPKAYVVPGSREFVNKLYDDGHIITFFTSRTESMSKITREWLDKNGFKYHGILFNKPRGGNYHIIDDSVVRASRFEGSFEGLLSDKKDS